MFGTDIPSVIFTVKIILFLPFLIAAAFQDLRAETVSDSVWAAAAAVLLPVIMIDAFFGGLQGPVRSAAAGILMFVFASVCFYFKIFGGADCKVFVLLAFFFPPDFCSFSFSFMPSFPLLIFSVFSSFPVSVLMNSLAAAVLFSFFPMLQRFGADMRDIGCLFRFEVPFLFPFVLGFITAAVFGNLIFKTLSLIFVFVFFQGNL